jgi:hypothetical protein
LQVRERPIAVGERPFAVGERPFEDRNRTDALAEGLERPLEPSHHLGVRVNFRFGDRRKRNI